jgi:hypothetical protein
LSDAAWLVAQPQLRERPGIGLSLAMYGEQPVTLNAAAFQTVFLDTIYWAQRFVPHEDQIAFVFEDRPGRRSQYEIVYGLFCDNAKLANERPNLVSLDFSQSKAACPLQAADLFAWEIYQEEMARMDAPLAKGQFHRKLIRELVKTGRFRTRMGDEDAIVQAIPNVEKLIGPEELAAIDSRFGKLDTQKPVRRNPK